MTLLLSEEIHFQGVGLSPGIVHAPFCLFERASANRNSRNGQEVTNIPLEISRFHASVEATADSLRQMMEQPNRLEKGELLFLSSELQLLSDPLFLRGVEETIQRAEIHAEQAVAIVLAGYEGRFTALEDPFFAERFCDIKDMGERLLFQLQGAVEDAIPAVNGCIVIAEEFATSDAITLIAAGVVGFIAQRATRTAHAVLVAKTRGLPFVVCSDFSALIASSPTHLLLDGEKGAVYAMPTAERLAHYSEKRLFPKERKRRAVRSRRVNYSTLDGKPISLFVTLGYPFVSFSTFPIPIDGVGLFRTEYLVLHRKKIPSEDEQYDVYRQLVLAAKGLPVTIRLFDLRCCDENMLRTKCREGGALDEWRFNEQLRALIRASLLGPVRLLLPLVRDPDEFKRRKEHISALVQKVARQQAATEAPPPQLMIGCMVEVPSAALLAEQLCEHCDFLAIGTNDLTQCSLSACREDPLMDRFYRTVHPAVQQLIAMSCQAAAKWGRPVVVCGDAASNPALTALFITLGVTGFSVVPSALPDVAEAIRDTSSQKN